MNSDDALLASKVVQITPTSPVMSGAMASSQDAAKISSTVRFCETEKAGESAQPA